MKENEIIWTVLEYHLQENLSVIIPFLQNGRFVDPVRPNEPITAGRYENNNIHSCFVVINGQAVSRELIEQRLIKKNEIVYTPVNSSDDLLAYLHSMSGEDGARILENGARVGDLGIIDNSIADGIDLSEIYPSKFLAENGKRSLDRSGGKTQTAAGVSRKFSHLPAHACIIKATAVNETATGTIAYLGPNGLEEEIFFRYAPELRNVTTDDGKNLNYTFIDDATSLIGVHRTYTRIDGEFVVLSEEYVGRQDGRFVLQPVPQTYGSIDDSVAGVQPGGHSQRIIAALPAQMTIDNYAS